MVPMGTLKVLYGCGWQRLYRADADAPGTIRMHDPVAPTDLLMPQIPSIMLFRLPKKLLSSSALGSAPRISS